jgi:hypothetical protein
MQHGLFKSEVKYRRLASFLVSLFVTGACFLGSYHLTHGGGWVSGTAELCFAVSAGVLAFGFDQVGLVRRRAAPNRVILTAWLTLIWGLAVVLLILSIYHFTHQGLPSGCIELFFTLILAATGCLTT